MYAERLKQIKKFFKLNTEQLASSIEIPARTLGSYERGESKVPLDLLTKLCKKYSINPAWFSLGIGDIIQEHAPNTFLEHDNSKLVQNFQTFHKRLNQLQAKNNLNDLEMATKLDISESRLEKLGIGKAIPTIEEINTIKSNFDISTDWLLYGIETSNAQERILSTQEIETIKKIAQKFI